jgi:prepilin peptidase CpaA
MSPLGVVKVSACVLLAMLTLSDLRARRLPNVLVAGFAALYFVNAAMIGFADASWGVHVVVSVVSLAAAALIFRLGWLGGGDVKLAAAVFLWAGPEYWPVLVGVSLCGLLVGFVVLAMACLQRIPALASMSGRLRWIEPARGVPYGVALALGGVVAVLLQPATVHRDTFAMLQLLV